MFDKGYSMLRMAALKTLIKLSKHLLCSYFMVNIVVSYFTTTINCFDIVVLGVKNQNSTSLTQ